ncbi:MAG: hypothetical protein ACREVK_08090 [Gammaproteobacteria bacterium]
MIQEVTLGVLDPEHFTQNLTAEDWADIGAGRITAAELRGFAWLMAERLARARGEVPDGWTAITCCLQCGEVPIWPGCPSAVQGCPWCHHP